MYHCEKGRTHTVEALPCTFASEGSWVSAGILPIFFHVFLPIHKITLELQMKLMRFLTSEDAEELAEGALTPYLFTLHLGVGSYII